MWFLDHHASPASPHLLLDIFHLFRNLLLRGWFCVCLANLANVVNLGRSCLLSLPVSLLFVLNRVGVWFVDTVGVSGLVRLALLNPYYLWMGDCVGRLPVHVLILGVTRRISSRTVLFVIDVFFRSTLTNFEYWLTVTILNCFYH